MPFCNSMKRMSWRAGKVAAAIAKEFAESEFEKYRINQDMIFQSDFDRLVENIENDET